MGEDLPTEYDVIVIGTGMVESIIAASAARIGKKVLHLDPNSYYGHHWATFNFENLETWCTNNANENRQSNVENKLEENHYHVSNERNGVSNVSVRWLLDKPSTESEQSEEIEKEGDNMPNENDWSQNTIRKNSRKFNIDLVPKFLFAKGEMVDILIRSQVSRYVEFINVTNILVPINNHLEAVPCSKGDIFLSNNISKIHKRILMRMLMTCLRCDDDFSSLKGFANKTFQEYLEAENVPENLYPYLYVISMSSSQTLCSEAVKKAQKFLGSLGCYGNTPFLWPLYGSSELLQAFCRLCAVYGGIYFLGKKVDTLAVDDKNKCIGVWSNGQLLSADHIVISSLMAPQEFLIEGGFKNKICRAILITNKTLYEESQQHVTWFQHSSNNGKVTIIELSSSSQACPKGLFLVHLFCSHTRGPEEDFEELIELFFDISVEMVPDMSSEKGENVGNQGVKPKILYALYFEINDSSVIGLSNEAPSNVYLCSGPNFELDFNSSISQANNIFSKMYPNEDFLQPPPNPNEE